MINAQQFPFQSGDDIQKGVCTINGKVYYGIDCWCYTSQLATSVVTFSIVFLVIFFCISGCVWACIFTCCNCFLGRKDDGFESTIPSLRASMRSSMRRRSPPHDSQI
jgi:hypothetical protein